MKLSIHRYVVRNFIKINIHKSKKSLSQFYFHMYQNYTIVKLTGILQITVLHCVHLVVKMQTFYTKTNLESPDFTCKPQAA